MENNRQSGSFPSELFGNKEPHTNDVFATIFPPSKGQHSSGSTRRDDVDKNGQQPCYMSSSLYYGGQESYSPSQSSHTSGGPYTTFKKDAGENDPAGASRGNWWQGSLYY